MDEDAGRAPSAGRRFLPNRWTEETPMNNCKHLSTLRSGILTLGIFVLGAPFAVMAAEAHASGMTLTAHTATAVGIPVHAPDTDAHMDETTLTSTAVIAVDDHWSLAEMRGNTAWLRSLLLPSYRSIRADGSVWNKEILLAHAAKNRGHGPEQLKAFDTWLKTHPMNESVTIHGDVAVLSFSDPKTGRVRLSNVFVHEGGRWHALYSQLTRTEQARSEKLPKASQ